MASVRRFDEQTYYEMLGVSPRAHAGEIAAAYARAVALYRSDSLALYSLFEKDQLDAVRRALESAYRTLRDEAARREYDLSLVASGRLSESDLRPAPPAPTTEPAVAEVTARIEGKKEAPLVEREDSPASARAVSPPDLSPAPPEPPPAATEEPGEEKLPPMRFDGPGLRALREARKIALDAIARETKISLSTLEAIEANRYAVLPARVYLKGFLKEYARIVRLDPEKVCEEYLRRSGK